MATLPTAQCAAETSGYSTFHGRSASYLWSASLLRSGSAAYDGCGVRVAASPVHVEGGHAVKARPARFAATVTVAHCDFPGKMEQPSGQSLPGLARSWSWRKPLQSAPCAGSGARTRCTGFSGVACWGSRNKGDKSSGTNDRRLNALGTGTGVDLPPTVAGGLYDRLAR